MGNIVDIQVSDEKIIFKIPHKNIVDEVDNVASFDLKTRKLIYAGISQKAYQELNPKKWEKYKSRMEFVPIFSVTSFKPEAAGMLLWDWWHEMVGRGIAGNIIFRAQAKLELNIFFDEYENVPLEKRQEFEYLLFRYLQLKKLAFNGVEKRWEDGKQHKISYILLITLNYIFIVASAILSTIPIVFLITELSNIETTPLLSFVLHTLSILGVLCLNIYIGYFVSTSLWILCLKPFISGVILFRSLEHPNYSPRKHKTGKLIGLLADWTLADSR